MTTEGIEVRSVGNTLTLHETALVEAFNLKAAIEYQLKNCKYHYIVVMYEDLDDRHPCIFCGKFIPIKNKPVYCVLFQIS